MPKQATTSTITPATVEPITTEILLLCWTFRFDAIKIFAVILSLDPSRAPPVGLSSLIQIMLSDVCIPLSTFNMKDSCHWPSVKDTFPDLGCIRWRPSEEPFWYTDHSTVMLPCEPLDLRTNISSLVTFSTRET